MDAITVRSDFWHQEGVDVRSEENGGNVGDYWRNVEIGRLSNLTLVTCLDIPPNIDIQHRPPEPNKKVPASSEDSLVSKLVVSI